MDTLRRTVFIDGNTVNMDKGTVYRGLGTVTGNNSSRLLMDYKVKNPEAYWEIMNLLFKPDYGAGLTHVKLEFGADVNSSSGTEPSIMRSFDETADVTRGAGFMFAADALSINPDITVDLLRWGEPRWIADAFLISPEKGFEARYKWYKAALDGAYDKYGIKFTHISADMNETDKIDTGWIIYFAGRLKSESDGRYDYGKIKIAASDEVECWRIADEMMRCEALRDSVDILAEHYNTWASDNAKILNKTYNKEIWYTEGIASMNIARLAVTSNGSGINGVNGALDVCNRIINGYYNGKMTMYEYQPAVAAYYSGARYFPKGLLNANTPWSGYYEADCGIWTSAHFTHFAKNGWRYIDSACYGDGKEKHSITETTNNYMTVTDTVTGDYSIIICNDSDKQRSYIFILENMDKADVPVTVWETRGPDKGQAYDENYFKNVGTCIPSIIDGKYSFSVEVRPYSIVTITTLDKSTALDKTMTFDKTTVVDKAMTFDKAATLDKTVDISVYNCKYKDIPLDINYVDDFEYTDEFLSERGNAPLYTTDCGGAFEVAKVDGNKVLMQMITKANKPSEWIFGDTPNPITSLGDDRWANYSVEIDFKFADNADDNYVLLGSRYLTTELNGKSAENGYELKIYPSGKWELKANSYTVADGCRENFDNEVWHNVKITSVKNIVTAAIDGEEVVKYEDTKPYNHSGRVSIGSGLYNNIFDNLKIAPVGENNVITRIDDHDPCITYTGSWERIIPDGFVHFNRTRSKAVVNSKENQNSKAEKSLGFSFVGNHFALIGQTEKCKFDVYIDGEFFDSGEVQSEPEARQCYYTADIAEGAHDVKIVVRSGEFYLDAVEY